MQLVEVLFAQKDARACMLRACLLALALPLLIAASAENP